MWINLRHLDDCFPDYDQCWSTVKAILASDPTVTVAMLVSRSTACSEIIYQAMSEFGTDEDYEIQVNARLHRAYPEQREPEKRLELTIKNAVGGEEE
jgi:hypothetical protein